MELRHLEVIAAVAEHGSFTAAADALNTVQSNISSHVSRLERELGVTLVNRTTGRLTPEGDAVLARTYRIMSEVDSLVSDLGALKAEVSGVVRAGMIGTTARWLVPHLLAECSELHPKLRLVVAEGTTTTLDPLLATGRLDLGVVTLPVPGRDLTSEALFREDLVLVVARDQDPVTGMERVGLTDLGRMDLLLPAPGTAFRSELDAAAKPAGVRLRPRAELDGVRLIASLTFEGYGPAILPATAVPQHLRDRFRLVPIDGLSPRLVGLVLRNRGMPSASTLAVIDLLRKLVARSEELPEGIHPADPPAVAPRLEGATRRLGVPNG